MVDELAGQRVLVVEDNYILATALAECVENAGAEVLGPCSSVASALALLEDAGRVDAAVLDVRLETETSEPVAARARENGIAVLLMTGFDEGMLPASLQGLPLCTKPFDARALVGALQRLPRGHIATTGGAASS
jgi:DNA-binding response OmpR family regulator